MNLYQLIKNNSSIHIKDYIIDNFYNCGFLNYDSHYILENYGITNCFYFLDADKFKFTYKEQPLIPETWYSYYDIETNQIKTLINQTLAIGSKLHYIKHVKPEKYVASKVDMYNVYEYTKINESITKIVDKDKFFEDFINVIVTMYKTKPELFVCLK